MASTKQALIAFLLAAAFLVAASAADETREFSSFLPKLIISSSLALNTQLLVSHMCSWLN